MKSLSHSTKSILQRPGEFQQMHVILIFVTTGKLRRAVAVLVGSNESQMKVVYA